jgi:PAS domain S-box-containing protein
MRVRSIVLLALVYVVAAKLSLLLAVVNPYATAVWPPTGIALASLLVFGNRLWPGVALGAFVANVTTGAELNAAQAAVAVGIAAGNTLEAVVGRYLVQRFAGGARAFDRARDVFLFTLLASGASTLVSAAIGVVTLSLAGLAAWKNAGQIGVTWWIGDAGGALIVAPALLLWMTGWRLRWTPAQAAEMAMAVLATTLLALLAFTEILAPHGPGLGLAFLLMPPLLWSAFRLGRRETATLVLLADAIAVWAWHTGRLTGDLPPAYAALQVQAFMGISSIMLLAIAAEVFQRQRQQEQVVARERQLRLVIDGIPGLVSYIGRDLRYRFVNRKYVEWFGKPAEQIEQHSLLELGGKAAFEAVRGRLEEALAGNHVVFEQEFAYPDGRRRVRGNYFPDRAPDGSVDGVVVLIQDITAEADALRALQESEESYRRIVQTAVEGIWTVAPDGVMTFVNPRMADLLGYTAEEMLGRSCFEFIHPNDREAARAGFQARKEGDAGAREYRLLRKDGTICWAQVTGAPIRDGGGPVTGLLGMCTDVTERNYNEARYQALFSTMEDGVLIVNEEGTYVDVNQSYCDLVKATREQLIGSSFVPFIPPERLPDAQAAFESLKSTGRYEGEFPLRATDGSIVELEWRSIADFVRGLHFCIARDVRERNRFQQQMQQTQKLESLGVLAGGIAHDFNNLLVGILGNTSLVIDVLGEHPVRPMLEDAVQASERAARLTRQLLAYAGKERLTMTVTDVNRLISELTPLLRTSIPKTVYLNLELTPGLPCVEADQVQLQQVAMNMVINGAEAIPEGRPGAVTVHTTTRRLTEEDCARSVIPLQPNGRMYVVLSFSDTGAGIAPEIQRKIFDPFFSTKFAGRGLGLSAVLGIVQAHHGALTLESTPGHGTTFRVLLPVTEAPRQEEGGQPAARSHAGQGTILVVDDEEFVRNTSGRILESRGYTVMFAVNGQEAIDAVRAHPEITAVLLDLAMPVMPGDQAAPELRSLRPELPILLSSGYPEAEATRRFPAHGITGFLQKPYSAGVLLDKIATLTS